MGRWVGGVKVGRVKVGTEHDNFCYLGDVRDGGGTEVIESMDDLSVSRNKIIRNSTQKVSQEY